VVRGAFGSLAAALVVYLRRGDVPVAEQLLYLADILAVLQQQRGRRRPRRVRRIDALLPGSLAVLRLLEGAGQPMPNNDVLALDEALTKLAAEDPLKARLVQLRFFAGLSNEEAAAILGVSAVTAKRHWRYARAWLHRAVSSQDEPPASP